MTNAQIAVKKMIDGRSLLGLAREYIQQRLESKIMNSDVDMGGPEQWGQALSMLRDIPLTGEDAGC